MTADGENMGGRKNELVDTENEMDEGRVTEGEENREQNAPVTV